MRENPASNRRQGSRLVVGSTQHSNYSEGSDSDRSSLTAQNESVAIVFPNAAHYAATDEENEHNTDTRLTRSRIRDPSLS